MEKQIAELELNASLVDADSDVPVEIGKDLDDLVDRFARNNGVGPLDAGLTDQGDAEAMSVRRHRDKIALFDGQECAVEVVTAFLRRHRVFDELECPGDGIDGNSEIGPFGIFAQREIICRQDRNLIPNAAGADRHPPVLDLHVDDRTRRHFPD